MTIAHQTDLGAYHLGDSTALLNSTLGDEIRGRVQLVLTSPPFPLNNKKSYGNLTGEAYQRWFSELAPLFAGLLTPDGSIVIELGNAWESGRPVQSLLHLESLIAFVKRPGADVLELPSKSRFFFRKSNQVVLFGSSFYALLIDHYSEDAIGKFQQKKVIARAMPYSNPTGEQSLMAPRSSQS